MGQVYLVRERVAAVLGPENDLCRRAGRFCERWMSTWRLMRPVVREDDKIDIEVGGSGFMGQHLDTHPISRFENN